MIKSVGKLFILIAIPLLISCGQDKVSQVVSKTDGAVDTLFEEFLRTIPHQPLPINLSCGLDETVSSTDFDRFKSYIPKSADRVFGRIDSQSDNFDLILYGETGDDIYPVLFSFDDRGQIRDSLFLILHGCGGADESAIPHSFVQINKDLTIVLTDTTRLIHYSEGVTGIEGYVLDSIRVSRVTVRIDGDGRFVKQSYPVTLIVDPVLLAAQSYTPKTVGNKWFFRMGDNTFTDEIIAGTFSFNGTNYFKNLRTYSWGDTDTSYIRVAGSGTTFYLDPKSNMESMDVPGKPETGYSWVSADNAWKYSVVDVAATFKTPNKSFENCLVIRAEQIGGRDGEKLQTYLNYYVRDIGYVGSLAGGELMAYIEKWELKSSQ